MDDNRVKIRGKPQRIVATIEARMTSSRLPGKMMLPASERPMIEHVIRRVKQVRYVDEVVLATTTNEGDDCLVSEADRLGISWFRGSEEDVMMRVIGAAESAGSDVVVEISGDCPVLDPLLVEQNILMYVYNPCDYAAYKHGFSPPVGTGDSQVFSLDALRRAAEMTQEPLDREHPTRFIQANPDVFTLLYIVGPLDLHWPELHLTLDTKSDYELLKRIIEHFGDPNPFFGCRDVVNLLRTNSQWLDS